MAEPPTALFRRWVHVHEEDSADIRVYRPAGHPLPPARGRDGIEFRPDGTVVEWAPGPVDAPVPSEPKTWTSANPDTVKVHDAAHGTDAVLQITTVTENVLRLRPLRS